MDNDNELAKSTVFKQQQSTYGKRILIPSGQFGMISLVVVMILKVCVSHFVLFMCDVKWVDIRRNLPIGPPSSRNFPTA